MTDQNNQESRKYLYNHTSQDTAYLVEDYPWGFKLRTKIRYWIESKKSFGQRFASQTINPKTNKWCAPKYSCYSHIVVMYLNEIGHIKSCSVGLNSTEEWVNQFKEHCLEHLTEFQMEQLKEIIAYNEVMKHVTFEFKAVTMEPISLFSNDPIEMTRRDQFRKDREQRQIEQDRIEKTISNAIHHEIRRVVL